MDILRKKGIDLVLTEIEMPDGDGMALLKEIKKVNPEVQVVMMTNNGSVDSYLKSMELGAFKYFNKPIKIKSVAWQSKKHRVLLTKSRSLNKT